MSLVIKSLRSFFNNFYSEIILSVFIILGVVGVLHHDMWHDEMQAWMIAQASHSIPDLIHNLQYESHPPLWYLLLFILKKFSSNPVSMQWLHLAIASSSAWLVLRFSPFSKFQKFFLVFGYFLFYEYSLISRSYALGVLLAFLFCIIVKRYPKDHLLLALVLILLCLTSIVGFILSAGLAAFLIFEYFRKPYSERGNCLKASFAFLLFLTAGWVSFYLMTPAADSGYIKGLIRDKGPILFFSKIYMAYFPITPQILHSGILYNVIDLFSVFILIVPLFFFFHKRSVLFLYSIGAIGFVVFFSIVYSFVPRHMGYLFILLITCWWICPQISSPANKLMTFILFFQLLLGLQAYKMNYIETFAAGKSVAEYIRKHHLEDLPIIGDTDGSASVSGYLGKRIFYAWGRRWGTYVIYDKTPMPSQAYILWQAKVFSQEFQKDVLLVMTHPLDHLVLEKSNNLHKVQNLIFINNVILKSDRLFLYIFKDH